MEQQLDSLPQLVIDVIFDELNFVDIMSLRFCCKLWFQIFRTPNLYDRLLIELAKVTDDPQKLADSIEKHKAVISGSFAVKLLYNADWNFDDVDVYVGNNGLFEQLSGIRWNDPMEYRGYWGTHQGYATKYISTINLKKIVQIIKFTDDPIDYVFKNFDTDICKVTLEIENQNVKVLVKNWNKMIRKQDYILPASIHITEHYCSRIHKFIDYNVAAASEKQIARMNKYNSRGFNLMIHPLNDMIIHYIMEIVNGYKSSCNVQETAILLFSGLGNYYLDMFGKFKIEI